MAIAVIFDGPGVTQAQYEQVLNEVAPGNQPPPGMLYHVASKTDTGWSRTLYLRFAAGETRGRDLGVNGASVPTNL